jgi:hypothetical protein
MSPLLSDSTGGTMKIQNIPDLVHNHLTIGLRPISECPACDQVYVDMVLSKSAYKSRKKVPAG